MVYNASHMSERLNGNSESPQQVHVARGYVIKRQLGQKTQRYVHFNRKVTPVIARQDHKIMTPNDFIERAAKAVSEYETGHKPEKTIKVTDLMSSLMHEIIGVSFPDLHELQLVRKQWTNIEEAGELQLMPQAVTSQQSPQASFEFSAQA